MTKIAPKEVSKFLEQNQVCFVDVRTPDEYASGHIPGTTCIPLAELDKRLSELPKDKPILLSCQSGNRSHRAKQLLEQHGFNNVVEVDGGFSAWCSSGLETNKTKRSSISIQRQVMMIAGTLVLIGFALGKLHHPNWNYLSAFVGTGLLFAGISGICAMARALECCPWNKSN